MIPMARMIYFNKEGICIGAGFTSKEKEAAYSCVMHLPSDSPDFLGPVEPVGKTKAQIEKEIQYHS